MQCWWWEARSSHLVVWLSTTLWRANKKNLLFLWYYARVNNPLLKGPDYQNLTISGCSWYISTGSKPSGFTGGVSTMPTMSIVSTILTLSTIFWDPNTFFEIQKHFLSSQSISRYLHHQQGTREVFGLSLPTSSSSNGNPQQWTTRLTRNVASAFGPSTCLLDLDWLQTTFHKVLHFLNFFLQLNPINIRTGRGAFQLKNKILDILGWFGTFPKNHLIW